MKATLACSFFAAVVLAPPAWAQSWDVSGTYTSCRITSRFFEPNLSASWRLKRSNITLMLRGAPLLPQADPQEVKIRIEPDQAEWTNSSYITPREDDPTSGVLLVYVDRDDFLEALAAGRTLDVFVAGELTSRVPLKGSAAAVGRFRDCLDRVHDIDDRVRGRRTF